ncbi:histone deacetylase [Rubellicoccus peritrichatus]|uniref:Histone deacetylase n=1 Tax=Rubellicoccus peritrichatus TaxID=3080537 RepID=A0AAQ3QVU3_9BACT|nr:histone deacetylase [Puniceicoccus sp. CR14]WOO41265.1 histone deacetylase [Puniceicoccus sp. CR14]
MDIVFDDSYRYDNWDHVFPVIKYRMLYEKIQEYAGNMLMVHRPVSPSEDTLALIHTREYLDDLLNCRQTPITMSSEFPLFPELINGMRMMAGGSILAAEVALEEGAAFHVGGGFHHAFAGHAEGFCYFNDIAIGAQCVLNETGKKVLVIDLDVHQGNGTARIFQGNDSVFTFSVHQENNYPEKQKSDLDIGLEDGIEDEAYLKALDQGLAIIEQKFSPDLVFYVAGVDLHCNDQLGGLSLTDEGVYKRDRRVMEFCKSKGVPVVVVLAGGYSLKIEDTVKLHFGACKAMHEVF